MNAQNLKKTIFFLYKIQYYMINRIIMMTDGVKTIGHFFYVKIENFGAHATYFFTF